MLLATFIGQDYARPTRMNPTHALFRVVNLEAGLFSNVASDSHGRVVERQTRWLQVPVRESVWGFKSPLAHKKHLPGMQIGMETR